MRHVQQLQRKEGFVRRRDVTENTFSLTPAEQLMSRESELQLATPLPDGDFQGDLVEHDLPWKLTRRWTMGCPAGNRDRAETPSPPPVKEGAVPRAGPNKNADPPVTARLHRFLRNTLEGDDVVIVIWW